jgi:hypothetical protein
MDRHKRKEGNYITALYEHEECILIAYLHKEKNSHKRTVKVPSIVYNDRKCIIVIRRLKMQSTSTTDDRVGWSTVCSDSFI